MTGLCVQCEKPLGGSPSDWWCSWECMNRWQGKGHDLPGQPACGGQHVESGPRGCTCGTDGYGQHQCDPQGDVAAAVAEPVYQTGRISAPPAPATDLPVRYDRPGMLRRILGTRRSST